MATHPPPRLDLFPGRRLRAAALHRERAAWVEVAARRRVGGVRYLTWERSALLAQARIRLGHRREERRGVRVERAAEERVALGELDHLAHVHDGDAVELAER